MKNVMIAGLVVLMAGALSFAGPSKKARKNWDRTSLNGAPNKAQVERAMDKLEYRNGAKITKGFNVGQGGGKVTFVPAALRGNLDEKETVERGVVLGKLVIEDAESEELEPGNYIVYARKTNRDEMWRVFYLEKGEPVSQAGTVKLRGKEDETPDFEEGRMLKFWRLEFSW
jgi:hypothetical protein